MARRKTRKTTTKRRSYFGGRRKTTRRRGSSLNAQVKKKTAAVGTAVALSQYVVPLAISSIQNKSVQPFISAFSDKNTLMAMGKSAVCGYAVGYAAGLVIDKTGLKKPVNKVLRKVF